MGQIGESGATKDNQHVPGNMDKPLEIVNQSDLIRRIEDLIEQRIFSSVLQSSPEEPEQTADEPTVPDEVDLRE